VKIRLHPEVTIEVVVNVARSPDEAERQARGENVINSQFEEERADAAAAAQELFEGGAGQALLEAPAEEA
jgi:large subunit ribosomal protein L9